MSACCSNDFQKPHSMEFCLSLNPNRQALHLPLKCWGIPCRANLIFRFNGWNCHIKNMMCITFCRLYINAMSGLSAYQSIQCTFFSGSKDTFVDLDRPLNFAFLLQIASFKVVTRWTMTTTLCCRGVIFGFGSNSQNRSTIYQ